VWPASSFTIIVTVGSLLSLFSELLDFALGSGKCRRNVRQVRIVVVIFDPVSFAYCEEISRHRTPPLPGLSPKLRFLITFDDVMGKAASRAVPWVTRVKAAAVMIRGRTYLLLQQEIEEERLVLTLRRDRIAALIKAALCSLFILLLAQIFWRTGGRGHRWRCSGGSANRLSDRLGGWWLVGAEYRPWRQLWWSVTPTRRQANGGNAQHRQHETGA
jgi:hypothetical protein